VPFHLKSNVNEKQKNKDENYTFPVETARFGNKNIAPDMYVKFPRRAAGNLSQSVHRLGLKIAQILPFNLHATSWICLLPWNK
jgi:hypothetical protein